MSDETNTTGPVPSPQAAHQSALGHFAAWAEHMMQGLAALGALHPMGMPAALSNALQGARARLDAGKAALEDGARAVGDAEHGDVAAAEGDLTSAGAEVGSAFHPADTTPAEGEVVSGGTAAESGPTPVSGSQG